MPTPVSEAGTEGLKGLRHLSLSTRFLLLLAIGIVTAQLISSAIWYAQWRSDTDNTVRDMSEHMAYRIASTASFFTSLPNTYRHVVLDQLRDMGGTRFFVSLNRERILVNDLNDSHRKSIVVNSVRQVLQEQLGIKDEATIEFSRAEDLHVLNNETRLLDLPDNWGASSLLYKPLDAPILVVQIRIADNQWLYLASLMPDPMFLDGQSPLSLERMFSLLVSLVVVLLLGFLFVRSLTRPLRQLTTAMEQFGRGESVRLPETGSKELVATARAVNDMQERIQRYLDDRQRLFASISHDLKTPITRLRLRAELLQREEVREAFREDLEDLEIMVKASLQCVKDTDIHETPVEVDIGRLLRTLQEGADLCGGTLQLPDDLRCSYRGKPLALKRCIGNLIDNAIYYGQRAELSVQDSAHTLTLVIRDFGPGIPADKIDRAFEPYTRLGAHTGLQPGHGLGLSIARNIARAHGGEITLSNHPDGGLVARLVLPR
ncbi:ATP-binding protein [Parathalassolituus penaei]|uniref:histidine kinase n=1 Tax=Parathalassolituus penaei TaxID=2997323 RepID=A0A9X3ECI6_9GAMM|nr:ATP-binding protein [Parathalassolituus penaei]MCY0965042.1 ATP-binding protein [Parathalassolituus penaei]